LDQSEAFVASDDMQLVLELVADQAETYAATDDMGATMAASGAQAESYAATDVMVLTLGPSGVQAESYAATDAMNVEMTAALQQGESVSVADAMVIHVSGITPVDLYFSESFDVADVMRCDVEVQSIEVLTYRVPPSGPTSAAGDGMLCRSVSGIGTVVLRNVSLAYRYDALLQGRDGIGSVRLSADGVNWFPFAYPQPGVMLQWLPLPLFGPELWVECINARLLLIERLT
jgi:hypothetical protein